MVSIPPWTGLSLLSVPELCLFPDLKWALGDFIFFSSRCFAVPVSPPFLFSAFLIKQIFYVTIKK
jgi:hypothetical protein